MNHEIKNTCGKQRGCIITLLPSDKQPAIIYNGSRFKSFIKLCCNPINKGQINNK